MRPSTAELRKSSPPWTTGLAIEWQRRLPTAAQDAILPHIFSGNSIEGVYVAVNLCLGLALGDSLGVRRLQVDPKCGHSAEIAGQPKGRVGGDAALPMNDVGDARYGNA